MDTESKKKIVIVEDDTCLCELLTFFMDNLGYELTGIFQEGTQAIEFCRKNKPDVVIMDINIHGELDGIKTAVYIEKHFDLPVLYLSSHTEDVVVKRAVKTNCYGFLVKPVDETALGIAIEQAYYKHQSDEKIKKNEKHYRSLLDETSRSVIKKGAGHFPHRRLNILTGEWILVSPQRNQRSWQGMQEAFPEKNLPEYDNTCYLCPGNKREMGQVNSQYKDVFVFVNDFSALLPETENQDNVSSGFFTQKTERGICKVICFSPRHDLSLAEMDKPSIRKVIDKWCSEYIELGKLPYINYVQIFENKGAIMGCSNPHPHGQIWAQESIPNEPAKETEHFKAYYLKHGKTLLGDYLFAEQKKKERIVFENDHFSVLVPFWAVWPFETMIISKRDIAGMIQMSQDEKDDLADAIKRLTCRYDNLFKCSFPYSAGIHQSPTDKKLHPEWHFHIHFYPPLLRSETIKKFMVGYEMLCEFQRDITPEFSAKMLRLLPDNHYKEKKKT